MTLWPMFLAPGLLTPPPTGCLYCERCSRDRRELEWAWLTFLFFLEESFSLITSVRFQGHCVFPSLLVSRSSCYFFVFLQSTLFLGGQLVKSQMLISGMFPEFSLQNPWQLWCLRLGLLTLRVGSYLIGWWPRPNTCRGLPSQKPWGLCHLPSIAVFNPLSDFNQKHSITFHNHDF